jgi:hypothetical protein
VLLDAAASARADRDAATLRAHREHRLPWDQRDRTAEESAGPRLDEGRAAITPRPFLTYMGDPDGDSNRQRGMTARPSSRRRRRRRGGGAGGGGGGHAVRGLRGSALPAGRRAQVWRTEGLRGLSHSSTACAAPPKTTSPAGPPRRRRCTLDFAPWTKAHLGARSLGSAARIAMRSTPRRRCSLGNASRSRGGRS